MKILIATGLKKTDIGGPAQYGSNLKREFEALGHEVRIGQYGSIERALIEIWPDALWADRIIALDTFSVGLPSIIAGGCLQKKVLVRVGGDFLWSAYVNRTKTPITLPDFYKQIPSLNFKEKTILYLTKWMMKKADFLAFNTEWQKNIWTEYYKISADKCGVLRNFIPDKREALPPSQKRFVWAGRLIPEKNIPVLNKLKVEMVSDASHKDVLEKLRDCYAVVSLAFTDVCPNFIIEGISFNKPFIMTKETGLDELFPRGGIFVNPFDETEVKNAFEAMLDENTYNKHVGELKSLNLSHSWRQLAEEILQIWKIV